MDILDESIRNSGLWAKDSLQSYLRYDYLFTYLVVEGHGGGSYDYTPIAIYGYNFFQNKPTKISIKTDGEQ